MNKVLVGVISSLATLGIVGGAGAIALSSPNVKESLSVSFGQNTILENTISANNEKVQQLSNELAEKNKLLAEEQNKILNLTNQVDKLNEDKIQYKVQIANLKGDNENLTSEVATLTNQVNSATNQIANLQMRVDNYQTQITNLRNTNTRLNESITTYRNENNDLKVQLSDAIQDYNMMQEERDILAQDIERYFEQVQELDARIIEKDDEIIELNNQIMSKQMTIYDLQAEVESYSIRISEFENEIANANSEIAMLNVEIQVLNNDIQYMSNQIVTNGETITELATSIAIKDEEILTLQSNLEELNNTINTLNIDISNLQVSIEELNNKVNYYETALGSNYIIINYIVDGVDNPRIHKKWDMANFTPPNKSGYQFSGWSYTPNGEILISGQSFSTSVDLYAVYQELPTLEDFDNVLQVKEDQYICWNSSNGGEYEGIYSYIEYNGYAFRVASKYYDWKLLANADNELLIFVQEEQNTTLAYVMNCYPPCVTIANTAYTDYHILSDNSIYLYNDSHHQIFNGDEHKSYFNEKHDGNKMNVIKELDSGNYILGSRDSASTRLYHFNMETKVLTTIHDGGSAWGEILEFKDNAPFIFSCSDNANGFLVFNESDMTTQYYEVENCGRVSYLWQLDYGINRMLFKFDKCMVLLNQAEKTVKEIEFDSSIVLEETFSLSNWDYIYYTNDGIYSFSNANERIVKLGDIGELVEHSEYGSSGNCLLVNDAGEKYVYISNTQSLEVFDETKDYTTYIGENNE